MKLVKNLMIIKRCFWTYVYSLFVDGGTYYCYLFKIRLFLFYKWNELNFIELMLYAIEWNKMLVEEIWIIQISWSIYCYFLRIKHTYKYMHWTSTYKHCNVMLHISCEANTNIAVFTEVTWTSATARLMINISLLFFFVNWKQRMVMAITKLFLVPRLNSNNNFEEWLHKTEIWQCLTHLDKKKQGSTIYLSLDDNIRKTCSDIKVKDLNSDDGGHILKNKLNSLFSKMLIRLRL